MPGSTKNAADDKKQRQSSKRQAHDDALETYGADEPVDLLNRCDQKAKGRQKPPLGRYAGDTVGGSGIIHRQRRRPF
jgi:hypothetical protein